MAKQTLIGELLAYLEQGIDPLTHEQELWQKYGEVHAVLVLDSTGFTRTTQKHGIIHFLVRLAQKRHIAIPIIQKYGCETYITEADSIIALFPNVLNAIEATKEIQRELKRNNVMLSDDEDYQICAGIGYGKLLVTGEHGEFFGPEMNIASKLGEDTAEARELMISENAYASLPESMKQKFVKTSVEASGNDIPCYIKRIE